MTPQPKMSRFRKSLLLTRGAWRAFLLDKKLASIPVATFIVSVIIIAIAGVIGVANPAGLIYTVQHDDALPGVISAHMYLQPLGYVLFFAIPLLISAVTALGVGAVTHGALERFRGNIPTIGRSLAVAWQQKFALFGFVILNFIIAFIIGEIANRIPYFGGLIVSVLAGTAWNIAAFFSIPIIIEEGQYINPLAATKKSVHIMNKTWGESLLTGVTVSAISAFIVLGYIAAVAAIIGIITITAPSAVAYIVTASIAAVAFVGLMITITMLEVYAKAAIYFYATTSESPAVFDKDILRQAFTTKKAKKVFSA